MSFNDVLEAVEKLPQEDQETLIEIVCRRQIERRRAQIVKEIAASRRAYRAGKTKVGTPAQIMREILS